MSSSRAAITVARQERPLPSTGAGTKQLAAQRASRGAGRRLRARLARHASRATSLHQLCRSKDLRWSARDARSPGNFAREVTAIPALARNATSITLPGRRRSGVEGDRNDFNQRCASDSCESSTSSSAITGCCRPAAQSPAPPDGRASPRWTTRRRRGSATVAGAIAAPLRCKNAAGTAQPLGQKITAAPDDQQQLPSAR